MEAHLEHWTEPHRLVYHHIAHYEHLINVQIPHVIESEAPIVIHNHSVRFGTVAYTRPSPETPSHARAYDETYQTTVSCKAYLTCMETGAQSVQDIHNLAKLPVMVRAPTLCQGVGECAKDPGGFFIIKGKERVIIPHIHTGYNIPITSYGATNKALMCEMRTHNEVTGTHLLVQMRMTGNAVDMSVPYIKSFLPAGVVFHALGVSEEDMLRFCNLAVPDGPHQYTSDHPHITHTMLMQYHECDNKDPFKHIAEMVDAPTVTPEYAKSVFAGAMFCHTTPDMSAQHLGYMVATLVQAHSTGRVHDKDDLKWKRVDTSGALVLYLFRNLFKQWLCTVQRVMQATCVVGTPDLQGKSGSVNAITNVITNVLHLAFATGNWLVRKNSGTNKNTYTPRGVSQLMCAQNYGARLSNIRRMTHAVGFKGKNIKVRQLHNSHYGYICPYETPEGDRVGNVVQLALSATVALPPTRDQQRNIRLLVEAVARRFGKGPQPVLLNGEIVAWVDDRHTCGTAAMHTLWMYDQVTVMFRRGHGVHVYSEGGRLIRPLTHRPSKAYRMVCPGQVHELTVAVYPGPTERMHVNDALEYMELPGIVVITDAMSAVIPFYNHTQSPRNAYQSNMGKQAVGVPCLNYANRWDVTLDVLAYPQKPLSCSKAVQALSFDEMPHGACPIVAVLTFDGYNQEDSVILNRSSVQRGLFVSTTYKTLCDAEKRIKRCEYERIMRVPEGKRRPGLVYTFLGDDGVFDPALAGRDAIVATNTVVVGKMAYSQAYPEGQCCSLAVKAHEEGYYQDKIVFNLPDGCKCVKVKLRKIRIPEMGDKFASFTAQKGTCGIMFDQWDMPFTAYGVVPDLIINPHAFPSRMTVHYLLQMCFELGAVAGSGKGFDTTAFNNDGVDILKTLEDMGYAKQIMYCGRTGMQFESLVFMAPCPYQRLKHLVANKMHARTTGPVDPLTRQPVAGRSRDGGIKIGEMEQWCKISHGTAAALHESMTTMSDPYTVPVCSICHGMADNYDTCRRCKSLSVESYAMPYTSKLFFQLLASIGINTKIE